MTSNCSTLGSGALTTCTLGNCGGSCELVGSVFLLIIVVFSNSFYTGTLPIHFRIVVNSRSAFLVEFPAYSGSVVVNDEFVRMVIISSLACFKKSLVLKSGKVSFAGKNMTVSIFLSDLVFGKNTFTQQ